MATTRKTAHPDATTVIALTTEMAVSAKAVIDSLGSFAALPKTKPISEEVERIADTARLINLRSVALLGDEIVHLARLMEAIEGQAVQAEIDAIRGGLNALFRYLTNASTSGKLSSGLGIHSAYAELARSAPGRTPLNRGEIFLPVYAVYGENSSSYNAGKFVAEIARYQDEFHQALLRYNQEKNFDTINAMRTTLVTMETKMPPANFRMFFSLAISYLDIALRADGKIAKEDEGLLTRIDRELSEIVRGDMDVSESTISWFFYVIAQAAQFSARIRTFQDTYELTRMIDHDSGGIVSEQTLSSARTALENSRKSWETAMIKNGEVKAAKNSTFALAAVCNTIGDYSLKTLSVTMGALADGIATDVVPVNPETAVFGASILIAIGDRIERILTDPKGGRAIADFHKDRVRAVLSGKKPSELASQMHVQTSYSQEILDEVYNNVSAAEQIIDQCVREGIKETKAEEAIKLLSMASSALMLINLMDGADFADKVTVHVKVTLDGLLANEPASESGNRLMAESVMLLSRYIKLITIDLPQSISTLNKGMAMFATEDDEVPTSLVSEDDGPFEVVDDEELGPIFFEEAKEVIQGCIMPAMVKLDANIADEAAFADVRRGFHTIKGSARMVGLVHIGMISQHIEHALNIIRDTKTVKLVPDMLIWMRTACTLIEQTVGQLEAGLPAKVVQAPYQAVYEAFASTNEFVLETGMHDVAVSAVAMAPIHSEAPASPEPLIEASFDHEIVHIQETGPVITPLHTSYSESDAIEQNVEEIQSEPQFDPSVNLSSGLELVPESVPSLPVTQELSLVDPEPETVPSTPLEEFADTGNILNEAEPLALDLVLVDAPPPDPGEPPIRVDLDLVPAELGLVEQDSTDELPPTGGDSQSDVMVGDLQIPSALYQAFVEEAKTFYANLDTLVREMINGKRTVMDFEAIRLAHSLAGMGRTTGLTAITEMSGGLETWAALQQDHTLRIDAETADVLRDTLEALEGMIIGVSDLIEPMSDTRLVARMNLLIEKEDHRLAHGSVEDEMTPSVLERIEAGGEISDLGVDATVLEIIEIAAPIEEPVVAPIAEPVIINPTQVRPAVKTPETAGPRFRFPAETNTSVNERTDEASYGSESTADHEASRETDSMAQNQASTETGADNDAENRTMVQAPVRQLTEGVDLKHPETRATEHGVLLDALNSKSHTGGAESSLISASTTHADQQIAGSSFDETVAISVDGALPPAIPESTFLDETVAMANDSTIFPSTIAIHTDGERVQDSLDEVPVTQEFAEQLQREIDELVSTPSSEIQALIGDEQVDVVSESVYENAHSVFVEEFAIQEPSNVVRGPIDDSVVDVVVESISLQKPEAVFVAPLQGHGETSAIGESLNFVPPTIEVDVGTTTSINFPADGTPRVRSTNKAKASNLWLDIVQGKEDIVDPEMQDIFLEEAQDRFVEIDNALSTLASDPSNRKLANSLKRGVHTLKGSANTTGARKVGAIFHYLEDLMNESPILTSALCETVQAGVDAAFAGIQAMKTGRSIDHAVARIGRADSAQSTQQTGMSDDIAESSSESNLPSSSSMLEESVPSVTTSQPSSEAINDLVIVNKGEATVRRVAAASSDADDSTTLRVSTKALDRMVKSVGEINISRTRIGMNVDMTKLSMTGLAISLERMYGYLRDIEMEAEKQMHTGTASKSKDSGFDALQMDRFTHLQELTRRVAEAQNDVMTHQGTTLSAVRDMEEAVATQRILVSDVSGELDRIRQVRVSSIVPNLKRVVRAACRDTGKQGEIYFDADVEIDRGILDKINGPIEHILRNAVAHGIESPSDRLKAHKDEIGTIEFRAYQDGSEVVIEIRDDGHGIDIARVLQKAVDKGVVRPGTRLTEDKIRELLFEPGFSTAESVSDIAGRGVGLDVVRSEISAMGGRVDLKSTLGSGTTFILRLPATLTVIAGASVLTNGHMYVIPVSFIDRLVRVSSKDLEASYKSQKLIVKETSGEQVEYDFWGMWQVVGAPSAESRVGQRGSILLMRGDRVAVHVDEIRPATEFVFRPMGPQLTANSGLIGSTINASGNATLVLDPARVVRSLKLTNSKSGKSGEDARSTVKQQVRMPMVLIVDDSLTVRKVTERLLKKEGFRHSTAENGMQALERIQSDRPDVILMDIEMPVMNGYEATQAIRATPETQDIPIIMITSRVGESHREKAFDLGVNDYLGKPYNDSDLMKAIRKHTKLILDQQT